jgi:hypothetical protein
MTQIWIPRKEIIIELPTARPRVRGYFKLDAIRPDGRVRPLVGWFPNLITDSGLNRIGTASYLTACHVGTNNTAPSNADTSLAGYVAGTTTRQAWSEGAQSSPPYYGWTRITYRFAVGVAAGNLAEVGIASQLLNAGSVNFSRALILDEFGDPTTVTVLGDEVLDVTYELRLYPPLVDVTGTFTISGSGDHDYTLRAASVTNSTAWASIIGNRASLAPYGSAHLFVTNGAIGAITSTPSGTSAGTGVINNAYSNNSLTLTGYGTFGLNAGNLSGGISTVRYVTSLGAYQYDLDPIVDKTDTKTLVLTNRVSWGRYTP